MEVPFFPYSLPKTSVLFTEHCTEAEFMGMYNFLEVSGHLRVIRVEISVNNIYITNQFQPTFPQGGGGVNSLGKVTVNSKEENSCPNYVQEFGLCRVRSQAVLN
jgi:hypothetical protein